MGLILLNLREPPIRQQLGRTVRERLLKSQVQNRLPKRRRITMAICTFNARTLASEACIEDLMMQANKIKNVVIGLTERRRHRQLHAASETGKQLFLGTCGSRDVGGAGALVNTCDHEHRLKLNNPNQTFAIKKMWLSLVTNIKRAKVS
uniref:Endonuclease exonuclease phosphatase domain containing protein n=1 Tax=Haemonchus contortus TaxID=6289 RepID=A0A7I4YDT6_HAECO